MKTDPDFDWLKSHLPKPEILASRTALAENVCALLQDRIATGMLPYTLGVFGGWGSGKTTFLAQLAERLERFPQDRIIYFNSWKYAGFMEIVPSLIYKMLKYGVADTDENRNKAAVRVLLSLGKEYSDRFGKWAEERIGVNPVGLFKDVYHLKEIAAEGRESVRPELLKAYYNQVDRAQDALAEVLGTIEEGKPAANPLIVLIDELDRCDPDEAFNVIKQMRVLFAMRRLPVLFVVCANPEPIGLAIKHRYGLESASGDYEARRILEKFVDAYEDLSESAPLGKLIKELWGQTRKAPVPWIIAVDEANGDVGADDDTVHNATAYDAMTTAIHQYANLRVLKKSLEYVCARAEDWNRHLVWTAWHLEIAGQIDPEFRQELRTLATVINHAARDSYAHLASVHFRFGPTRYGDRLIYETDKGKTLFGIFRSYFWETSRAALVGLEKDNDPQAQARVAPLTKLLANPHQMDFVILLCLLPFSQALSYKQLCNQQHGALPDLTGELDRGLRSEVGWLIANY